MEVKHLKDIRILINDMYVTNEVSTLYHNKFIKIKVLQTNCVNPCALKPNIDTLTLMLGHVYNLKFIDHPLGEFKLTKVISKESDINTKTFVFKPILETN